MSLHVLLAHSGASLTADPRSFVSLEDLRSWISRKTTIDPSHQILMTARGKQVKIQTLLSEQEIFLYDRRILASSSSVRRSTLLPKQNPPHPFSPGTVPNSSTNDTSLQEWQILFKRRRAWAIALADGSRIVVEEIQKLDKDISVVRRGAAIAVENIKQHVGNLQPKYHESKSWANQICEDQGFLLENWQNALRVLGSLRAYQQMGQCLHGVQVVSKKRNSGSGANAQATLRDFVDLNKVNNAARSGTEVSRRFTDRVLDLTNAFEGVVEESSKIIDNFQQSTNLSDSDAGDQADRLMEEIEVLARKVNADYEHVLGLPDTDKSILQASKTAHLHKNNFLPSLVQTNEEISQLLADIAERKEQATQSSVQYLQEISIVESKVSSVHSKLAHLDVGNGNAELFDVLNFVMRLPSIYGSLLVECVRRQEWSEKMTADSSSLVEEMATYEEEEAKRRKKWVKDMGGAVDLASLDDMALGIEVNVHAQKQKWPKVNRDDITEFTRRLGELGDLDGALKQIEEHVKTLNTPSKQQARRAKAFKNGSVHEAAYGRTSLLLRGDDEVLLAMRSEKSKVEDKLKSAESRVRKLEDLLHRQSQLGPFERPTSAPGPQTNNAPTFERHATSPVTNFSSALTKARETRSRKSSISSRRISMTVEPEEKGLAQRIVSLEAELMNERAQSADLATKAAARSNAEDLLKSQVREATSTKEDLLGNLEAQQREFEDERRLLEDENNKLRLKLEELEDEFDRVFDNREYEDRIHVLEEELEHARRDAADELERAHGQAETIRNDYTSQCEKINVLERELQQKGEENTELNHKIDQLSQRLQSRDQVQTEHHRALRTTLLHLSPEGNSPEDFIALVDAVETVAEKSAAHLKDIKDALEALRTDNGALETRVKTQDDEIYDLRERLGGEEREVFSLREELSVEQTQSTSLKTQLDFERHQHDQLKTKFASGETDSEVLRAQLTDKESMVADLLSKVVQHESQHHDLEGQLAERETSLEALRKSHKSLRAARDAQSSRAVEVSKKMLSQNILLERLLEQVGLIVTKEDDVMIVQKAPRTGGAGTVLGDPSMSMKRSLSGPTPMKRDPEPSVDPEVLYWADAEDLDEVERRFSKFTKEFTNFDIDVFSEAVYKRVKEIEHIARKWQKEARAYRDKSHRAQGEAHDRIALRNFKEGDLALFLPTRDQATKPWAAFNVGAPHCFLREQDSHNLGKRDWLIARISRVEERVVDLSKSINGGLKGSGDQRSAGDKSDTGAFPNDENPYELSDGLRWYLIDAAEEKPGAPINVGTGKVTVASANVDAKGSIRMKKSSDGNGATKTLTRSLDSRRSSTNSKKGLVAVTSNSTTGPAGLEGMLEQSIDNAAAAAASSNLHGIQQPHATDRVQSSKAMDMSALGGQSTEHVGNDSAPDW